MLSYQHEYHAGNLADMHKYCILFTLWNLMKSKGKPLTYIDTHAGRGVYKLDSLMAQKTGEWHEGFGQMRDVKNDYVTFLRQFQKEHGQDSFPGSLAMINALAGDDDKIYGAELHPAEYKTLAQNYPNLDLRKMDGIRLVEKMLPATTKKSLVLIDPSYEVKSEYETIGEAARKALRKDPGAVIAIWYPILDREPHKTLEKKLRFNGVEIFTAAFPKTSKLRMKGTALAVIGAPFGFSKQVETSLAALEPFYASFKRHTP